MPERYSVGQAENKSEGINTNNHLLESPAIESFLDPIRTAKIWPAEITSNENFSKQLAFHKELNGRIDSLLSHLPRPDLSLETAITKDYATEEQVARLYESLNALLESGQNYERIILYLPFEFLPKRDWKPSKEKLQKAIDSFKKIYLQTWHSLLSIHDVRANFIDGDVLEEGHRSGDHPRVVKAAHLIPKLVEKGLLGFEDIIILMENSDDRLLRDSIADTLPVLADMGFIYEEELDLMRKSKDHLISNMSRIILADLQSEEKSAESVSTLPSLPAIQEKLSAEFSKLATADFGDITSKRKDWLQQKKKQEAIEVSGQNICRLINQDKLTPEAAQAFLQKGTTTPDRQALGEGIHQAIESTASADLNKAHELYARYRDVLLSLWKEDNDEIRELLAKTFRRLRRLRIVDDRQLKELGITTPKLAGPFLENLGALKKESEYLGDVLRMIESEPELSKFIYPAVIIYGSQLKGYGTYKSDMDLAVFIKPETLPNNRQEMRKALRKYFTHKKFQGEIIEFWLEEENGQLKIKDFDDPDNLQGESYWTHILFGGAWKGDENTIKELREKLLVPYLYESNKTIHGHQARELYLEELERDTLQYRLMHKGYEKFFPPYGGIHTPHADEIDGESMFWDSGYRQLATKLFASRVFLPKIPVQEK